MPESVYKIIELVGTSAVSWEDAAKNAISSAGLSLRDMRIAEVTTFDIKIEDDDVLCYRTKLKLSFKIVSE